MKQKIKDRKPVQEEPVSLKAEILSWIEVLVAAALIAFFLNTFIIANSRVPSASMETTIMTGDRVIGSRLTYRFFEEPSRGDIIIFKWPDNEDTLFVKRIIGLPGDHIEIRAEGRSDVSEFTKTRFRKGVTDVPTGRVYVNGVPLDEDYLVEPMIVNRDDGSLTFDVPEDAYFCMGDNRNNSQDARYWLNTWVYRDKILAKVYFRYWPGIKTIK